MKDFWAVGTKAVQRQRDDGLVVSSSIESLVVPPILQPVLDAANVPGFTYEATVTDDNTSTAVCCVVSSSTIAALVTNVTGAAHDDEDGGERLRTLAEGLSKRLEVSTANKQAVRVDLESVDKIISGIALKARVGLQNSLSESLEHCYTKLKTHVENQEDDLDAEIKKNRLPDHLQFLLALSDPPSASSLAYTDLYLENIRNPPPPPKPLTWADLIAEEPFTGDHWEGILDPIVVNDDWDSTPSLSPLNSDDLALDEDDSDDSLSSSPLRGRNKRLQQEFEEEVPIGTKEQELPRPVEDARLVEELKEKQYWRKDWELKDCAAQQDFDLGNASTLGPTFNRVTGKAREGLYGKTAGVLLERYVEEEDMVREVLMALQGRSNIALTFMHDRFITNPSMPRLMHLTPGAQISMLESFARIATTLQSLRSFTQAVFNATCLRGSSSLSTKIAAQRTSTTPLTRTSEAFADAVDQELRSFNAWCASREEQICSATQGCLDDPLVVSLLGSRKALSDAYDDAFDVVLEIVRGVFDLTLGASEAPQTEARTGFQVDLVVTAKGTPAAHATLLLDTLFSTLQEHTERNSAVVSQMLMRIFVRTAEPVWGMVGKWLKDGMSIVTLTAPGTGTGEKAADLEDEFFIESSGVGVGGLGSMGLLDPDFWREGYCLREQYIHPTGMDAELGFGESAGAGSVEKKTLVPEFLRNVAGPLLETGKAVGLVRALGLGQLVPEGVGREWSSFGEVIASSLDSDGDGEEKREDGLLGRVDKLSMLFSVSVDSLSRVVYDRLWPVCEATGDALAKIVVEDCEIWRHVNAVEDLFLMRRGDALSHFIDLVFAKMDARQSWADFHFLNTAFADVVRATLQAGGGAEWDLALPLVRFSHPSTRDADRYIHRTVRAVEGLRVEYNVPFPLTYIFRPEIVQKYSECFVLLVEIKRAKSVLERILVRGGGGEGEGEEMKVFWAMRSRLGWFANVLLNFLTTYVLHAQVEKFHEQLKKARSLDEIIQIHDQHVDRLQFLCFLTSETATIHRAILSILDLSLAFSALFTSVSGSSAPTHDVSRASISVTLKHRSKRLRWQERNVIGFGSASVSFRDVDSSDEDDVDDDASFVSSASMAREREDEPDEEDEGGAFGKLERMGRELDGLVRFVRRGVEVLVGAGAGEGAETFGVLAFALEDWDL